MSWNDIGITFGFMVIGYLIGSVLGAIVITKFLGLDDIRKSGSKNAGSTNAVRIHGKYVGAMVFIFDVFKTIIATLIPWFFFKDGNVSLHAVGIATVIGHIFPIFHRFKGGKGAACMLGFFIVINWTLFFIGFAIWLTIVFTTRRVSLGSILSPVILLLIYVGLSYVNGYRDIAFEPLMYVYSRVTNIVSIVIVILLVVVAHYENLGRLFKGKENQIQKPHLDFWHKKPRKKSTNK